MEKNIDPICDTYKSIAAPAEGLFKDNGSRFIALAYPVETLEQIREIVSSLKRSITMRGIIAMPIVLAIREMCSGPMMTASLRLQRDVRFSGRSIPIV